MFNYESQFNSENPIVYVGNEEYRYLHPQSLPSFSNSSVAKDLDFNTVLKRIASHAEELGLSESAVSGILAGYCTPTKDIKELKARQAVVREIFDNEKTSGLVKKIITSANQLQIWRHSYIEKINFGRTTEQIGYLTDLVESALALRPKSERLRSVKEFARRISKAKAYAKLKIYFSKAGSEIFEEYEAALREIKNELGIFGNRRKSMSASKLVEFFHDIIKEKAKDYRHFNLFDLETKRSFYNALVNFQNVVSKLMHDPELEGIVDRKEARDFGLERELKKGIKILSNTVLLDNKRTSRQVRKSFLRQLGKVISHVDDLINVGLESKMDELQVSTKNLASEFAFYYSVAMLAKDMEEKSPIVMPTIQYPETKTCSIRYCNVPSFILRKNRKSVANDVRFDKDYFSYVLTGPNDNGKTTFERMVGQVQLLTQLGSFIPAKSARISLVDGVFTFFGGRDNPSKKEGAFKSALSYLNFITIPKYFNFEEWKYVDAETPEEIKQAISERRVFFTPQSLLLLDEIAVGSDNLATEQALEKTLTAISNIGARSLLSTHFHPIAERVGKNEFPHTMNLGAVMRRTKRGKLVTSFKIRRNRHEPSLGTRLFEEADYTDESIKKAIKLLKKAGVIKTQRKRKKKPKAKKKK
ncbi:hypothetical protein KY336_03740 [Candidatus Woesearchaeota archaeon]|nr:hypothetical protein [Candidatus Woesearchaeota archaeon]